MAMGFTAPGVLFLGAVHPGERSFCQPVYKGLRAQGYDRFVELCGGGFAMSMVAAGAGWKTSQIEASDVSLFSTILGTLLAGDPLDDLKVRYRGEPVELAGDPIRQAGELLWVQLLARMEAAPDIPYYRAIVDDLRDRKDDHIAGMRGKLTELTGRLGGISYRPLDMWEHLAEVADQPGTVINANPPSYKAGFEKFYNTGGRIEWAEPDYEVFDPVTDYPRLTRFMADRAALLIHLEERQTVDRDRTALYARPMGGGINAYLYSNRPGEVFGITGGPKICTKRFQALEPLPYPILRKSSVIAPDGRLELLPVKPVTADYYRGLWMHRINATIGPMNVAVLVDGQVAGILGYDHDTMVHPRESRPLDSPVERYIKLRYAFGAPHDTYRLTRLATMCALRRETIELLVTGINSMVLQASRGLLTVEYTKHPEAKSLRGLMKLIDRRDSKKVKGEFELHYTGDWVDGEPLPVTLRRFIEKEQAWRTARNASR